MGITAGLIRYSAEVYDKVKAEGTFYPPNNLDIQRQFVCMEKNLENYFPIS